MKWSTTIASALFLTTAVPLPAGTFDNAGVAVDLWRGGTRAKDAHWSGAQSGHKDDWYADVRLSRSRNAQWAPDGSVRLGAVCAAAHETIAIAAKPLIFVYDQGSEDPEYVIVETYEIN